MSSKLDLLLLGGFGGRHAERRTELRDAAVGHRHGVDAASRVAHRRRRLAAVVEHHFAREHRAVGRGAGRLRRCAAERARSRRQTLAGRLVVVVREGAVRR